MGLFNCINRATKTIPTDDRIGTLLEEAKNEDLYEPMNYSLAIGLFKYAMSKLASRPNATFSISVKEAQVIMLKIDNWQIYWLADDPDYITLENNKGTFDKISADSETLNSLLDHLDLI
jgi:hypothetical protein